MIVGKVEQVTRPAAGGQGPHLDAEAFGYLERLPPDRAGGPEDDQGSQPSNPSDW